MGALAKIFKVYFTRLFFDNGEKDFIDFIIILTFPIWGFILGISCLVSGLINILFGRLKNGKK